MSVVVFIYKFYFCLIYFFGVFLFMLSQFVFLWSLFFLLTHLKYKKIKKHSLEIFMTGVLGDIFYLSIWSFYYLGI